MKTFKFFATLLFVLSLQFIAQAWSDRASPPSQTDEMQTSNDFSSGIDTQVQLDINYHVDYYILTEDAYYRPSLPYTLITGAGNWTLVPPSTQCFRSHYDYSYYSEPITGRESRTELFACKSMPQKRPGDVSYISWCSCYSNSFSV